MGFDYKKFEEDLFQEVMKHMETLLDKKADLYAFSLDYYPQVTVSIGFWANTYSYLEECMERNSEYYLDYKYNEPEWGIVESFDGLSKELEKEYERICAENEYDDCEARKAHNDKVFACCKNVMKQFKQTALYKEFENLSLNATIMEYFSDEEMMQTYEEINGKENAAGYRKFLFGE